MDKRLIESKNFRNVCLIMPDEKHIISTLCEAEGIPK